MKEFDAHGVRFRYPEDWSLTDESTDEKVEVTVQSDGTAFWTVAVFGDGPAPESLVESAVSAYREDYPDLDAYPAETTAGPFGPAVSREVEFVCLELIAAARVAAYRAGDRTVMTLFQCADVELESRRPLLDAMTASLEVAAPDAAPWPDGLFRG